MAGLDARIIADFPTILWVPSTDVLGGMLALGVAVPVGDVRARVNVVLTGPGGGQIEINRRDDAFVVGDPVGTAALGWNAGKNTYVQLAGTVNVPIGHYREGELANLAFHRWAVATSAAVTWRDPKAGWDLSAKAGSTFNGRNDDTDYNTGNELHLEAAVERIFSESFSDSAMTRMPAFTSGTMGRIMIITSAVAGTITFTATIARTRRARFLTSSERSDHRACRPTAATISARLI